MKPAFGKKVVIVILALFIMLLAYDTLWRAPSSQVSARLLIWGIKGYQATLSPLLGEMGVHCRYQPTCMQYAIMVLEEFGTLKGGWLAFRRILTCY